MTRSKNPPDGNQSITPYFTVFQAERLIAFLRDAFGGTVVKEDRSGDNRIQHARMRIGSSINHAE